MSDEAPSIEPWLSALRTDVTAMPSEARARLAARLVTAGAAVAGGVTAAPVVVGALRRAWWHSQAFAVAVALPVGAVIGAVGHAYVARTVPAPVVAPRAVKPRPPIEVPPAAPKPEARVAEAEVVAPIPPKPVVVVPLPSAKPESPSLERELSLLERARTRLSEGEPRATLQLLREHQLAYPTSALQQEREALTIRALVAAGRVEEARRRAESFVQSYPSSALRGSVERAVGSIP